MLAAGALNVGTSNDTVDVGAALDVTGCERRPANPLDVPDVEPGHPSTLLSKPHEAKVRSMGAVVVVVGAFPWWPVPWSWWWAWPGSARPNAAALLPVRCSGSGPAPFARAPIRVADADDPFQRVQNAGDVAQQRVEKSPRKGRRIRSDWPGRWPRGRWRDWRPGGGRSLRGGPARAPKCSGPR